MTNPTRVVEKGKDDFFSFCSREKNVPLSEYFESPDLTICCSGLKEAPLNAAFRKSHIFYEKQLFETVTRFKTKKLPFLWWEPANSNSDIKSVMAQNGLSHGGAINGVYKKLEKNSFVSIPKNIEIKEITQEKELKTFCSLLSQEFGIEMLKHTHYEKLMQALMTSKKGFHFLAYQNRQPIKGITLVLMDGIAGIWNEPQNIPGYESGGVDGALLETALTKAKECGFSEAIALLMNDPLTLAWEKRGFKMVSQYPVYSYQPTEDFYKGLLL